MQLKAAEIASIIEGEVIGDKDATVFNLAKIEEGKTGDICFLSNKKYIDHIYTCKASVVIIDSKFVLDKPVEPTLIKVDNAQQQFEKLLNHYASFKKEELLAGYFEEGDKYIHPSAIIADSAKIGKGCFIGSGVKIGDHTMIYPNVTIYNNCIVGSDSIIHSGTIIGADGFGFSTNPDGSYKKVPQLGIVEIGNNVEIGANVCIDRATMGKTEIHNGVKLDNLIQIGHNVVIKEDTVIAAQTGIAGSTKIEPNCLIGGQVGIVGHIVIAKGSKIQAQSGIAHAITEENKAWNDSPAFDYRKALKSQVIYRNLPELLNRIEILEQKLAILNKA